LITGLSTSTTGMYTQSCSRVRFCTGGGSHGVWELAEHAWGVRGDGAAPTAGKGSSFAISTG